MGIPITISSQTNLPDVTPKTPNKGMPIIYDPELAKKDPSRISRIDPYDTINFTNIYTDDLSKYKKYNVPTTRHFNWDDERAKNQGTGEKWLNGISKALVTTAGAVAENTLGVLAGLGEMVFGSGAYYDNFVGTSVDKANDWMREAMPNYRTQAEMDMTTGQKLGTANFWADTVANGAGYSLGSIATFWLSGGTGVLMRGANLVSKAAKSKRIYDVSKAITKGTQLADKTFRSSRGAAVLNSANMLEMGLYMSLAEASVEAREAQKQAYEGLINLELEKRGLEKEFELGDKVLEDILNASYSAGNTDFLLQLPVLAGTNLFMFGKQLAGFRTASKVNKDVALDAATKAVIDKTAGRGLFRTGLSRLRPTAEGSLTEAFQEGWQFASKVGAIDYHTDKYFNGGASDMSQSMLGGLNETFGTQEGLESMLVGAIVGGGIAGVTSAVQKPYAQRKKNAKYLTDLLNGGYLRNASNKGKTSNMMTAALVQMEKAKQEGNIKAFKDAQNKLIMYNAFEAMENGGFDVFMEKLSDASSLEDADFAKTFGYDTEKPIKEQTNQTKEEIVENLREKYTSFKQTYDSINEAFPSEDKKTGLRRMRMSPEEREAEETVYQRREGLRAQLILGMYGIKDRNSRLKSIHNNMQGILDGSVNLNNGSIMKDILALPEFGGTKEEEYSAKEENANVKKRLEEVLGLLIENNVDPLKIIEFKKEAQDYLALLAENQVAVESHIKLNSSEYSQELFEQERVQREEEAKQAAKDLANKKAVKDAKTEKDIKENVKDPKDEVKVDAEIKRKELKEQEQQEKKKYLDYYEGLPAETQILNLKAIDQTNLTDAELEGLRQAIKELEYEVTNKEQVEKEEPVGDLDDIQVEKEEEVTPVKRKIKTQSDPAQLSLEDVLPMEDTDNVPVLSISLKENPTLWVTNKKKVGVDGNGIPNLQEGDTLDGKPIIINQNVLLGDAVGREVTFEIIENDFFTQNHKGKSTELEYTPIYIRLDGELIGTLPAGLGSERLALIQKIRDNEQVNIDRQVDRGTKSRKAVNPNVKNKGPVAGKRYTEGDIVEVENKIEEESGDYFVYTRINKFAEFDENGNQTKRAKVEVKGFKDKKTADKFIADQYERVKKRAAEVIATAQESKTAKKVTTKISEILANNYNNAVLSEATETSYFYNIEEEIGGGSRNNVLLAFTSGVPGETDVVQWQVSEVSPDKNQKDLPKIKASVQTEQTSGRIDQIAVVARPENVPGGKPRIVLTSTANLSEAAKKKVIEAIQNKNYGLAAQIVAASMQIKNADQNPSFLTFDTFKGGEQYLVYYSPRLEKLIRITESEMIKALNTQKATYTIVEPGEDTFISKGKRNTESDKFNLKEDFESFLNNKKYHVDKPLANTTEQYVSPVTGLPYNDYQEYLFSSAETGNRVQGEGHYSILSVDTTTINESLFNNPRVTFERGNLFGKTAGDVISAAELTAMKTVVEQPGKAAVAPQGFKDKFNKKNCK